MISNYKSLLILAIAAFSSCICAEKTSEGLPLYYWQQQKFVNFGDYMSLKLVERIVDTPVRVYRRDTKKPEKKLLAIGSILSFAAENDVIWGTGINGKVSTKESYLFHNLDVRSVRGPLTRDFLMRNFQIECPEIYGDPALLIPYFYPEYQKKENPSYDYIVIPHYSEESLFPKTSDGHIVYSTDPWQEIIARILDAKLVIASSLHGVIIAEAFGVPARLLRVTENESMFKFVDYYLGTNRPFFKYATSVEEALEMGGEVPFICDLEKLYNAFPFEFWPSLVKKKLTFTSTSKCQCTE